MITSSLSRGEFYASNLRSVTPFGVETVMNTFFSAHNAGVEPEEVQIITQTRKGLSTENDVLCDDELLEAFGE